MKRITLIIASIILLCNISFGQRIEWWENVGSNYVTYYDDNKLTFDSGDGKFSGKYELLSDGHTLTYEVTVNLAFWEEVDEFSIHAELDEPHTESAWWDVLYTPYPYTGSKTFSGSVYLNYTEPKPFYAHVGALFRYDPNFSFYVFPTYYPN